MTELHGKPAVRRWTVWAGVLVVLGCLVTIGATLNDIF
jgi:hypothetical protein